MSSSHHHKAKFKYLKKVGGGSFGEVYAATSYLTREHVAIKREGPEVQPSQLQQENKIIQTLSGAPGFPLFKYFGYEGHHTILATELLGKNLRTLMGFCGHRFSIKTTLMIAEQILAQIQFLHSCHIVHRDIKAENFVIGRKNHENQIYMIDFGLCKYFEDPISRSHAILLQNRALAGTAKFVSLNTHSGLEQSRRDDLESIGYLLFYFLLGRLPWQGIELDHKQQKLQQIADLKKEFPSREISAFFPEEFTQYLTSVRNLKYEEKPDYAAYRALFRNLFIRLGYTYDYQYDWVDAIKKEHEPEVPPQTPLSPKLPSPPQTPLSPISPEIQTLKRPQTYSKPIESLPLQKLITSESQKNTSINPLQNNPNIQIIQNTSNIQNSQNNTNIQRIQTNPNVQVIQNFEEEQDKPKDGLPSLRQMLADPSKGSDAPDPNVIISILNKRKAQAYQQSKPHHHHHHHSNTTFYPTKPSYLRTPNMYFL